MAYISQIKSTDGITYNLKDYDMGNEDVIKVDSSNQLVEVALDTGASQGSVLRTLVIPTTLSESDGLTVNLVDTHVNCSVNMRGDAIYVRNNSINNETYGLDLWDKGIEVFKDISDTYTTLFRVDDTGKIKSDSLTANKILVADANKNIVSGGLAESNLITTSNIGNQSVNYATSAGSVSRATFGDSGNGEHNANNMLSNGLYYYTSNGPATSLGASTTDGAMYVQAYSANWVAQIAQDYRNGSLFVRGKNNGTWQAWKKILDSTNGILRDSDNGSASIYWKEYGYGDKFRIVPQFSGADDSNYLRFQGAVGGAGTDPSLYDLMYITGKSGNMWLKGSLSIATAQRITYGTQCSIESLGSNNTVCICGNAYAQVRRYDNRNTNQGIYAAAFTVSSSKLIKENVKNLSEEEAKKLLDVRVVDFDYIEKVGGEKGQHGVIAEEVLDIIPFVVSIPNNYNEDEEKQKIESDSDEMINVLGVDYAKFTPYLIKMIQMQQKQINDLKRRFEG